MMYEELVKKLRRCGKGLCTEDCPDWTKENLYHTCQDELVLEAADAIEERDKYALTIQHEMMAEAESHIVLVERLNGEIEELSKRVPPVPHGDLIDRDALRQSIKESIDECHKWADEVEGGEMCARVSQALGTFVECSLRVKAAPTIIPAEEGE